MTSAHARHAVLLADHVYHLTCFFYRIIDCSFISTPDRCLLAGKNQIMALEAHERKNAASGDVPPFDICSGQWEWTPDSKDAYVTNPTRAACQRALRVCSWQWGSRCKCSTCSDESGLVAVAAGCQ